MIDKNIVNTFSIQLSVSNLEARDEVVKAHIRDRLLHALSESLADNCFEVTHHPHTTEYTMRLYVLTPDMLEKMIRDRAEKYNYSTNIYE